MKRNSKVGAAIVLTSVVPAAISLVVFLIAIEWTICGFGIMFQDD